MDLSYWSDDYLARKIDYLNNRLKDCPKCSFVYRKGVEYIRVMDKRPYVEKSTQKTDGKKLLEKHKIRINLEQIISEYYGEWKRRHGNTIIPKVKKSHPIRTVPNQMTIDFYDKAIGQNNPIKQETKYIHKDIIARSRFEINGLEALDELGLEYKYEVTINAGKHYYSLDILIAVREKNRCVGIELCGRYGDVKYMYNFYDKFHDYCDGGLVPWHDIFFIFGGDDWMPSMEQIKRIIVMAVENC